MTDEINQIEEGSELQLDFDKIAKVAAQTSGVIPVAVQDADTKEVILVAYVNRQALKKASGRASPRSGAPPATSCGSRA